MQLLLECVAVLLLVFGAILTVVKENQKEFSQSNVSMTKENWKIGGSVLIFSTIFYCVYTVISTWRGLDFKALIFPQSLGMVIGALLFGLRKGSITKS